MSDVETLAKIIDSFVDRRLLEVLKEVFADSRIESVSFRITPMFYYGEGYYALENEAEDEVFARIFINKDSFLFYPIWEEIDDPEDEEQINEWCYDAELFQNQVFTQWTWNAVKKIGSFLGDKLVRAQYAINWKFGETYTIKKADYENWKNISKTS